MYESSRFKHAAETCIRWSCTYQQLTFPVRSGAWKTKVCALHSSPSEHKLNMLYMLLLSVSKPKVRPHQSHLAKSRPKFLLGPDNRTKTDAWMFRAKRLQSTGCQHPAVSEAPSLRCTHVLALLPGRHLRIKLTENLSQTNHFYVPPQWSWAWGLEQGRSWFVPLRILLYVTVWLMLDKKSFTDSKSNKKDATWLKKRTKCQ